MEGVRVSKTEPWRASEGGTAADTTHADHTIPAVQLPPGAEVLRRTMLSEQSLAVTLSEHRLDRLRIPCISKLMFWGRDADSVHISILSPTCALGL